MPRLQIGRVAAERSLESLQQQVEHLNNELGSAQVGGGGGRAHGAAQEEAEVATGRSEDAVHWQPISTCCSQRKCMHRWGQTSASSPRSHSSHLGPPASHLQASVDKLEARVQDEARTRAALEEDLQVCV